MKPLDLPPVGLATESSTAEPGRPAPGPEAPAGPTSPTPTLETPGLAAGRAGKDHADAAHGPASPGEAAHEEPSTGSSATTAQPGVIDPPAGGPPPKGVEEPPAPAGSPAADPAPSRSPEIAAGLEAVGGLGSPAAGATASTSTPARDAAEDGWVRIPKKGRIPSDLAGEPDAFGEAGRFGRDPAIDPRGRAGTDPGSQPGSSAARPAGSAPPATTPGASARGSRAAGPGRVEPTLHTVERGENFWTISRLYYGDGRYYRALWKANSHKYPDIRRIHIKDVIEIPAIEDLDPALVDNPTPPRAVAGRGESPARAPGRAELSGSDRAPSFPTTRTARRPDPDADAELPARRPGRAAPQLELPFGDAEPVTARGGRGASPVVVDDSGPTATSRSTARPRRAVAVERPVYRVRRYDTLRSIARDVLGDPRRAEELYDLNREIIDDPTRLAAGLLLELPEDADTRRITARDRSDGRD